MATFSSEDKLAGPKTFWLSKRGLEGRADPPFKKKDYLAWWINLALPKTAKHLRYVTSLSMETRAQAPDLVWLVLGMNDYCLVVFRWRRSR